jgi:predicted lipoprotein with Yx(FWY)xxD motif
MNSSWILDRRGLATLAVVLAGTLILAGCGGGDSDSGGSYGSSDNGSSAGTGYGNEAGSQSADSTGKSDYGSNGSGAAGGSMAAGAAVVSAANVGDLGKVLVDDKGMTLYMFEKDKGGKSACYGGCAEAWPPLATDGDPVAKNGAVAGKLGTTGRTDGSTQVTYAGWPLYLYAGDQKPDQAKGNDIDQFGAEWYALTPSGEKP